MITRLYIENYALIDALDINLHPGFSVITGETGAGKSIILGAIGLLLGQRSSSQQNAESEKKTIIEAEFDLTSHRLEDFFEANDLDFDSHCIIRREITPSGKSRAFINDTPATITQLKTLGDRLIDIHSQHQNLLLNKEDFQLNILDTIADDENLLSEYSSEYKMYKDACSSLRHAKEQTAKNQEEEDYLRFQYSQLCESHLKDGEQEELEAEASMLTHAEEIKQSLFGAYSHISNDSDTDTLQHLRQAISLLENIEDKMAAAQELSERLNGCYIELKDINDEIEREAENVEYNPKRLEELNDRINTIYMLEQKHHVNSISELLAIESDLESKLNIIDNSEEYILRLEKEMKAHLETVKKLAEQLSSQRQKSARMIEEKMVRNLLSLGMPNVKFDIEFETLEEPCTTGMDKVTFLFSANKNMPLKDISQIASGGEIARVMLSLKSLISSATKLPTIIFDEIDTGVSGSIAEKMAHIMSDMSEGIDGSQKRQVISITHLPQIAASGSHHYKVYKQDNETKTTTNIVELSLDERITELAHMLSGETLTQAALDNAKELLRTSKQ